MAELKLDYLVDEAPMLLKYLLDLFRLTNTPAFAHYNLPPKKLQTPIRLKRPNNSIQLLVY
jgi:hypothetical protein